MGFFFGLLASSARQLVKGDGRLEPGTAWDSGKVESLDSSLIEEDLMPWVLF